MANYRSRGASNGAPSHSHRKHKRQLKSPETISRTKSMGSFEKFCNCTSLHGWKYLNTGMNKTLRNGWVGVVLASMGVATFFLGYSINDFLSSTVQTTQDTSRASLDQVYFPSVTLCNINQGRRSFFLANDLNLDTKLLSNVLAQAYFGLKRNLTHLELEEIKEVFSSEEVMKKGVLADIMYMKTPLKEEALNHEDMLDWAATRNEEFVNQAGWYFKTLAAQETGQDNILLASYGKIVKDVERYTDFLPFFGTDYGLCSLIKPQISFNKSLSDIPFDALMRNFTKDIRPGIQLGKENGLTLLLDAEVYDYAFSPQKGEGFKLAIHYHLDQPIMALSDIDLSPGFVTQLSVTPVLRDTTSQARLRFTPEERGCYFDGELEFKYLPRSLYRYGLSNCLFAATYDQILERCNCVPFFHTMAFEDFPRICSGISLLCMNTILRDIGSHTEVWSVDPDGTSVRKPCLFACEDQSYTAAVTTSIFPNMHTFLRSPEFCLMYRKLTRSCKTSKNTTLEEQYPELCSLMANFPTVCSTDLDPERLLPLVQSIGSSSPTVKERSLKFIGLLHRYARENLLLANIYIKDPAVTRIKRDQKLPIIWFVANVGGIMGLCMGCSLVTLFEVFHHLALLFLKTGSRSFGRIRRTIVLDKRTSKSAFKRSSLPSTPGREEQGEEEDNEKPFFVSDEKVKSVSEIQVKCMEERRISI